jgi:hypothetical protein
MVILKKISVLKKREYLTKYLFFEKKNSTKKKKTLVQIELVREGYLVSPTK